MAKVTETRMASIIISNLNGKEHLRECLTALMNLNYPNYEIIVVDAGSVDGTTEMVEKEFPGVKLIEMGKIGTGEANNEGIHLAEGELIVFDLNNDDVVEQNWLKNLGEVLYSSEDIGIVCGKRLRYHSNIILDSAGGTVNYLTGETPQRGSWRVCTEEFNTQKDVDYVGVIATKRRVIERVGLYDPGYYSYFGDSDFCVRAKRAGYRVVYVPPAILWHKGSATVGLFSYRQYYWMRRSQIRFVLKNYPIRFMIPAFYFLIIFRTILDTLLMTPIRRLVDHFFPYLRAFTAARGNPVFLKAQKDAIFWNLRNIRDTFRARLSFEVGYGRLEAAHHDILNKKSLLMDPCLFTP